MRNKRMLWAAVVMAAGMMVLAGAGAARAETLYYTDGFRDNVNPSYPVADETDLWLDPNNWNTQMDGSGTYRIPAPGDFIHFGTNGIEYVRTDIDLDGNSVYLPDVSCNLNRYEYRFIDSVGGATLTLNEFKANMYGPHSVAVPLIAHKVWTDYRVGTMTFFSTVDANELDFGNGNIKLHSDVTVADSALFRKNGGVHVYLQPDPADTNDPIPTLTTPLLNVQDVGTVADMNGYVVSPAINIYDGGTYNVNLDGAMGDASTTVTLSSGGILNINAPQTTSFPGAIAVGAYSVLAGDMTGSDFTGSGNVTFAADAIYAPSVEPAPPTRTDLGGDAILYQGVTTGNATVTVGDNEVDAIYKGAAVGAFYGSTTLSGISVTAEPGSGNLQVVFAGAGCPDVTTNNKFFGDANRTADIQVLNGAAIRLKNSFNSDYDYVADADPTRIDTFNITGEAGKESRTILDHYRTSTTHLKEGQTWNISNGKWNASNYFAGKGQHGDLTLTDGIVGQPGTAYSASDSGFTMTLGGTFILEAHTASTHGYYEALDANFSYSGKPIITLTNNQNYDIDYDGVSLNPIPIMADLMQNADISSATYVAIGFVGDLRIGHGKYLYNALYRQDDHAGVTTATGAQIIPAGNQPGGETAIIGIAATALGSGNNIDIDMEINGPDAIVRCGTTDPNRIVVANSGGFVAAIPTGTVIFKKNVTAQEIQVKSGSLTINAGVSLISESSSTPFQVTMDTVTATGTVAINAGELDAQNPVTITGNAGANLSIGSNLDLSDTTIIANAGLTRVTIGGNNSTVILGNLTTNVQARIGSNNGTSHLEIVGTLSGTGYISSEDHIDYALIQSTGTVAPGDGGVGEFNKGGDDIRFEDGATLEWEIADPDAAAGTGWDLLWGRNLDFDVDDDEAGDLTINIIDAGLTRDVVATEKFAIMAVTGGFDIPATWNVNISGAGFGGTGSLVFDDTQDIDGDAVADKAYYLTGITSSLALIGDADGNGVVDAADYIALKANMGQPSGAALADGDFDDDGDVDFNDLQLLQAHYGEGAAAAGTIPEPATLGLLAIGAMAVIRRRRKA